jgi:hypothetical protein
MSEVWLILSWTHLTNLIYKAVMWCKNLTVLAFDVASIKAKSLTFLYTIGSHLASKITIRMETKF